MMDRVVSVAPLRSCTACGAAIGAEDRFCARCGTPVGAAGPSLQVADRAVEQERRVVTVLFADLAGSTALAEQLDPEDMRRILEPFFDALATEIQRFGGTIDKYAGDAVMAAFGAPVAHEDDPERALRCALAIQAAMGDLNARLVRERGARLALRVGVNTGPVVAGPLESDVQRAYTVVGDAVNTAQRLQSIAQGGEIIVGPNTHRLTYQRYAFDSLGPVRVKGRSEPIIAYRLVGTRDWEASARERAPLRAALVGRARELAAVRDAVAAVAAGEGRVALITGEAGLGKSRLVAEARRAEAARPMLLREGRATSTGRTLGYGPFLALIRQDAGITDEDAEAEKSAKLERRVRELFGERAEEMLPPLASLAGLSAALADRLRYVDANAMKQRTFAAARQYVTALVEQLPTALVFEDWHWADTSSAELLEHLLPLVRTMPLLVSVIGRDEPESPIARIAQRLRAEFGERLVDVALVPLAPRDSERLAASLLGTEQLPAAVRSLVLEKTEGNPFFIEELMRTLLDAAAVEWDADAGAWRATEEVRRVAIPETLVGLIRARIDRLDEEAKQVLKVASAIGRFFPERLIRELAGAELPLDAALAALTEAGFVRERRRLPELEYSFKHALIHDAAYESILLQRRRELHLRVGDAIERLYADRLDEFYGVLAYQFARAEEWERAQAYLFKAGDQASRIAADAEVLGLYREAFDAYARVFGERWDPVQRAGLERKIGEALYRRGEHALAREHFVRALALLGKPMPEGKLPVRLAIVGHALRQLGHRKLPWLVGRRPVANASEIVRIGENVAWIDFFADPEPVVLTSLRTLNYSEEAHYEFGAAYGCMGMGIICNALALHRIADWYYRRGVAIADAIGHPLAIGLTYNGLAYHEQHALADAAAAERHYARSVAAYKEAGDLRRWASPAALWSMLLRYQGELARSITLAEEVTRVGEEGADGQTLVWGRLRLGGSLVHAGDLERGESLLRAAIDQGKRIPDHQSVVCAMGFLGEALMLRGEHAEARSLLEDAAETIARHRLRTFYATQARVMLAHAYLAAAERGEGEALALSEKALRACAGQTRLDQEAIAPTERARGTLAWLRGRREEARAAWQRSLDAARRTGGRYEAALTLVEIARRDGDRPSIDEAVREFEAIGARARLQEARGLL